MAGVKQVVKKAAAGKLSGNKTKKGSKLKKECEAAMEHPPQDSGKMNTKDESDSEKTEDFDSDQESQFDETELKKAAESQKSEKAKKNAKKNTKADRFKEFENDDDPQKKAELENRGLLYLKYLPVGFLEPELKLYFSQFGHVTRVRCSRSRKSGRSKGYGWVEFADKEVAKIAQESMDGYLIFGKKLSVKLTPESERPPRLFLPKYFAKVEDNWLLKRRNHFIKKFNNRDSLVVDGEKIPQRTDLQEGRYHNRQKKVKGMLEDLGIDFDLNGANVDQDLEVLNDAVVKGPAPKPNLEKQELKRANRRAVWLAKRGGTVQETVPPETAATAKMDVEPTQETAGQETAATAKTDVESTPKTEGTIQETATAEKTDAEPKPKKAKGIKKRKSKAA